VRDPLDSPCTTLGGPLVRVWFAPARPSQTRLRPSLSAGDLHRPLLRVHPVYTHATKILTLHAKHAAKVTSVTLSRAYFMAGPHTQPPAQSSIPECGRRVSMVASCTSPKGVVQVRKRCATLAGQPPWCDQISTPAENQLYPFSEHSCAHRHSHDSRKLPVIGG
jgi:hypothetical protein